MKLNYSLPERCEAKLYQLEMLPAERYTYDGDIEQDTKKNMNDSRPQTTAKNPNNITEGRQTTCITAIALYLSPERC